MKTIQWIGVLLLIGGISWVNGQSCGSTVSNFSGEIKSPANESECYNGKRCSWHFVLPHQTMLKLNFTTTFISQGSLNINITGQESDIGRVSLLTLPSNTDEVCWINREPGNCLNEVNTTCMTEHWDRVTDVWVNDECQPSKVRFKFTYEYIDCKTGKRLEQPTTTALQTPSQSVTVPLNSTNHIASTTQANKPNQTTHTPMSHFNISNQTTHTPISHFNISNQTTHTPMSHFNISNQTTHTPISHFNISNQTTHTPMSHFNISNQTTHTPMSHFNISNQTIDTPMSHFNISNQMTSNPVSTDSLMIILPIVASVMVAMIAVVIGLLIYWKYRQQGDGENIARLALEPVYEEIAGPLGSSGQNPQIVPEVDGEGYLSPMPQQTVQIQSVEEAYEIAYADIQEPDYIVPENIPAPKPPIPIQPSRKPPTPKTELPHDAEGYAVLTTPSNPSIARQTPIAEVVYAGAENDAAPPNAIYDDTGTAPPENITAPPNAIYDDTGTAPPENITAPPNAIYDDTGTALPDHITAPLNAIYDDTGTAPPKNITAPPNAIYADTGSVMTNDHDKSKVTEMGKRSRHSI
uniref:uncharacterized protein LOC120335745 n=1 Tax=Styela clava TaxID=7725 RepID=UPI001939A7BF|nr:uncharacterized protein LOC120335745 [Styela clava]XP_039259298.1 uncharacterized protein LOC120335745 [Styela clava]XP_039259299.1 uncharacterized protein LOC120335745 [Styela clava]